MLLIACVVVVVDDLHLDEATGRRALGHVLRLLYVLVLVGIDFALLAQSGRRGAVESHHLVVVREVEQQRRRASTAAIGARRVVATSASTPGLFIVATAVAIFMELTVLAILGIVVVATVAVVVVVVSVYQLHELSILLLERGADLARIENVQPSFEEVLELECQLAINYMYIEK